MDKIFILGANSFVGKTLYKLLKEKQNCQLLSRKDIDLLKKNTFSNIDFTNSVIIDCINVNNGNKEAIMNCNYFGFMDFCNFLIKASVNVKYVYISTISTLSEDAVNSNDYVRSKKNAEDFLIASGLDYQVIRLSYPIGKGENETRLLTRMINLLKKDADINIQDIQINFNNINDVCKSIIDHLLTERIVFISNNIYSSLYDCILFLKEKLNSKSNVIRTVAGKQFTPKTQTPFIPASGIKETLLELI